MKVIEVGTGYTSIPASMGAATEIVVEELTKSFMKKNINVEIFDIKDENRIKTDLKIKEVYVPKILRRKDVKLGILHKVKRVIYSMSLANKLKNEIKKSEEPLIIHFHNQYNMFFFLKLTSRKIRKRAKLFYTVHSYIWNGEWEEIKDKVKNRYFQEIYSIKNADKVFVLNNITKEHFIKKLNILDKKIKILKNGVNTQIYKPIDKKNDNIYFFQVGSICNRKNQLGAIKELNKLFKENKNIKYMYAGGIIEEDYKNKIDKYVLENNLSNQVEYLGEIKPGKELRKYYNESKALIFQSKAEAFSLVILEAMACGLPVIMKRSYISDIDKRLEKIILCYEDESSLKEIISKKILNEQERIKIAKASRELIEKEYSWDAISEKYIYEFKNNI